ncbi:MAG: hypothetical protein GF344_07510 [Chitinivibrionales bacterium]|nr:hypothetical protein [Chitinivibrionales bacterium]MBD3356745.1 hypothetical protein [Chitinivibrionales bacterium]
MAPSFYLLLVSGAGLAGIFILFLVLSKTLNGIVNHLTAIQYYLEKELEVKKEYEEIKQILDAEGTAGDKEEKGAAF